MFAFWGKSVSVYASFKTEMSLLEKYRKGIVIRSGGQTGVDRAALDIASAGGFDYRGWVPRGGWAEDYTDPPGLRSLYPKLNETLSDDPNQRTAWNTRDGDATLILGFGRPEIDSPGTALTLNFAERVFQKPCLVTDIDLETAVEDTRSWLDALLMKSGDSAIDLNIAGPRESESPGLNQASTRFLEQLFGVA